MSASEPRVNDATVLVVDDSEFWRRMISDMIGRLPGYRVVGAAADGEKALSRIAELSPDIVTLDIQMPGLDGFSVLERVMPKRPRRFVVLSGYAGTGSHDALHALELGAIDFVAKPTGPIFFDAAKMEMRLFQSLEAAREADIGVLVGDVSRQAVRQGSTPIGVGDRVVAIAASTGGPRALSHLLGALPADLGAAVLVVQHMPPGFTATLAARLTDVATMPVVEASGGEKVVANRIWIAPGDFHMRVRCVNGDVRIALDQREPIWGTRPAADALFRSVADVYTGRSVGIVLTGMGRDGAEGLAAIRSAGGRTLAQDKATSVVYGMPGRAVQFGAVERSVPLWELPRTIVECLESVSASG